MALPSKPLHKDGAVAAKVVAALRTFQESGLLIEILLDAADGHRQI